MSHFENIVYPISFKRSNVQMHLECKEELLSLIETSGNSVRFRSDFMQRINYLAERKEQAVQHIEWFEDLKHMDKLYAMRFIRIDNLRILYVIQKDRIYLLCAFKETSRKRGGESYAKYAPVAYRRMEDIEGGDRNE